MKGTAASALPAESSVGRFNIALSYRCAEEGSTCGLLLLVTVASADPSSSQTLALVAAVWMPWACSAHWTAPASPEVRQDHSRPHRHPRGIQDGTIRGAYQNVCSAPSNIIDSRTHPACQCTTRCQPNHRKAELGAGQLHGPPSRDGLILSGLRQNPATDVTCRHITGSPVAPRDDNTTTAAARGGNQTWEV